MAENEDRNQARRPQQQQNVQLPLQREAPTVKEEFWLVSIVPASGESLSPFMDRPLVMQGTKSDAIDTFKQHYGIISTMHSVIAEPSTKAAFDAQLAEWEHRRVPASPTLKERIAAYKKEQAEFASV